MTTRVSTAIIRDLHWTRFLILLGPILLYYLNGAIVPNLGVPLLDIPPEALLTDGAGYTEAIGRNRVLGAFLFFTTVVLVATLAFYGEWNRALSPEARRNALIGLVAVLVIVSLTMIEHRDRSLEVWRIYHQMGNGVIEAVLAQGDLRYCQQAVTAGSVTEFVPRPDKRFFLFWRCTDNPVFELFRLILGVTTFLSGLGVAALVLGMILSLARPHADVDLEIRALEHGRNQRAAKRFLYLSGLMLSTGMFLSLSWMQWPYPMIDAKAFPAYKEVISAVLFYNGVFYTLLIVTGFGPVMMLNARYSEDLAMEALQPAPDTQARPAAQDASAAEPSPPPAPITVRLLDDWKQAHGLRISMTEAIQALVATTSPLLTAFAGGFAPL